MYKKNIQDWPKDVNKRVASQVPATCDAISVVSTSRSKVADHDIRALGRRS